MLALRSVWEGGIVCSPHNEKYARMRGCITLEKHNQYNMLWHDKGLGVIQCLTCELVVILYFVDTGYLNLIDQ